MEPGNSLSSPPTCPAKWGYLKTNKPDRFDIGDNLTAFLDHYLGIVRPVLLGDSCTESFWVGQSGRHLTLKGLTQRVHILSRQQFGYSFGPHAFRHALSTMLAEHDPHAPGLAAAVLRISRRSTWRTIIVPSKGGR